MNKKQLKEFLYDYPNISKEIERLNKDLKDLLGSKYETGITVQMGGIFSSNREISDKTGEAVIKISEIYDKRATTIKSKIDKLLSDKDSLEKALKKLNHMQKIIIQLRYFENLSWYRIAEKIIYSEGNCHVLHRSALNTMIKNLSKEVKYE